MAKEKQHVFSARTTEEGLRRLNRLKAEKGVGWDDLVIDAVCAHYGLEKAVMSLPKAYKPEKPAKETQSSEQQAPADETTEERLTDAGQDKPTEEAPAKKKPKKK